MASISDSIPKTQTGGRPATKGVIPGRYALSVGRPDKTPPSGWKWTALSDVARLESGHTPSRRFPEYWDGNIPWIGIKDATDNHGSVIFDTYQHVTQEGIENSSARILPAGTVCLSRTASVGFVVVMGRPMATSQDFVNWVCSENIDNHFLKYVLVSEHDSMLRFASGTTHQTIYYPEAKAFHVCLPNIKEQRAIAEVLIMLDDKIELNRRMNQTLESIAQAVFHQWLLKGQQDDWEEKPLDEIAYFLNGLALQNFPAEKGSNYLPVIKIAQLRKNDTKDADKASTDIPPEYIIENGDILFSWSGSLEVAIWCGGKGALNQHLFKVTSEEYPKWFYYYWTKYYLPTFQEIAASKATTMGHIQRHHLKEAKVIVPSDKELQQMDTIMSLILEKIIHNEKETRTLMNMRDTFLPKLMMGEIRVKYE